MRRRIGIDVGGTNTDAVLLEDGSVSAAVKTATTPDVTAGITRALAGLVAKAPDARGAQAVMIGTTIGAMTAPMFVPALKRPVANARSRRGNHSATVLICSRRDKSISVCTKARSSAERAMFCTKAPSIFTMSTPSLRKFRNEV